MTEVCAKAVCCFAVLHFCCKFGQGFLSDLMCNFVDWQMTRLLGTQVFPQVLDILRIKLSRARWRTPICLLGSLGQTLISSLTELVLLEYDFPRILCSIGNYGPAAWYQEGSAPCADNCSVQFLGMLSWIAGVQLLHYPLALHAE